MISRTSRIAELAATIQSNTVKINDYLQDNDLPFPSFDTNGPLDLNIKSQEVQQSRSVALDALQELTDLLRGPIGCLMPKWNSAALKIIHKYQLAQKVPLEGKISYEDLAAAAGLDSKDLQQIIRHAIAYNHLFAELEGGYVTHSAGSKALAQDDILRAGFGMQYDFFYQAFDKTCDAVSTYKDKEPNHTAFTLAFNTDKKLFDWFKSHPDVAEEFSKSMTGLSRDMPGFSESFLVNGYDWASLGSGTVVDIGGSNGYISMAVAKQHPSLKFIVQDLDNVIESSTNRGCELEKSGRISFQAHDFFTPQPVVADSYLFRWVLHDWPDHYVQKALKNLVPALRPGAKVILNESLCPLPGVLPMSLERGVRSMDLDMLSFNNSRLRTVPEWQEIFKAADTRFGDVKCSMPEGASLAILEVVWRG